MELKEEFIIKDVSEVAGFNRSTSKPYGMIMLTMLYTTKQVRSTSTVYYNAPHNGLLYRGWIGKMGAISLAVYQYLKFLEGDMIYKVCNNQ